MNKFESEYRHKQPIPTTEEQLKKFIRSRWIGESDPTYIPSLDMTPTLRALFETPDLWLTVKKIQFVPAKVPRSLIVRADGKQNLILFDVFMAKQKVMIAARYGVQPVAAGPKGHIQYWDKLFARCLFVNIQQSVKSPNPTQNRIAYRIRENVDVEEMFATKFTADMATINRQKK